MNRTERKPNGFTLVELVVVIGVFAVLLAVSGPSVLSLIRSSRLVGSSNALVSDLYRGRAMANTERTTYEIRFRSNGYSLVRLSPASTVINRTFPLGVTCAATDTATFFAWGLTAPITVTVTANSRTKTVRLAANGSVTHD